jgi:hypothetical protein
MGTKDSDIVTRLDRWAIEVGSVPASDLMDEAAAEIERLRADWPEQLKAYSVRFVEQELEIARLRRRLSEKGDCPEPENAASKDNESVRKTGGDFGQPSPASAGSQPMAWAVAPRVDDEIDCEFVYPCEATAGDVALDAGGVVIPLYRQPTLTDEEREAVEVAAEAYASDHGERFAATLRKLLARLSPPAT